VIISLVSSYHCHFKPHAPELGSTDESRIPLTYGRECAAVLQFHDKGAVWANLCFLAYPTPGIAWEDYSAAVKKAVTS